MAEITFCYAAKDDISILVKLAREIINSKYSSFLGKESVEIFINSGQCDKEIIENIHNCVIMKTGNNYIGFSIFFENKIHLMMVAPEYEKQGYGSKLLNHIENKLFLENNQIELQSFAGNVTANSFYERNGWKNIEKLSNNGVEVYKFIKMGIHLMQVSMFSNDILASDRFKLYSILEQPIKEHGSAF